MKIRRRLILLTSSLVILSIGFTSFLIVKYVEVTTVAHEIESMQNKITDKESVMRSLHQRASQDIVFALQNPLFEKYFELPETKSENVYKDGVLQFTERQRSVKNQLEKWIFHFQTKFTIDETCLIDSYGQEHSRLVSRRIESDKLLSSHEQHMPFFRPSLELSKDEVYVQSPYLSPDTQRWVFAYTSPVVLRNGDIPAFFHFEMPVKIFQDLLAVDYGRMFVIDEDGFLIADSNTTYPNPVEANSYEEYFPHAGSVFSDPNFFRQLTDSHGEEGGVGSYANDDQNHHVIVRTLQPFDWLLVYEMPESIMMGKGDFSVNELKLSVFIITLFVISGALISVFFISKRITDPISKLGIMTRKLSEGALDSTIVVKGDDEIHDLAESFNSMAGSLKRTIALEKSLAIAEQDVKHEKLAAIGSLSARIAHEIRNPLSTIKTTVELLQMNLVDRDSKTDAQLVRLKRAVDAMTFQVNSVLEFVRTRALRLRKCSSREIISNSLNEILIPRGITIDTPEEEHEMCCDQEKIEGVISNLVLNAIQAVGEGGHVEIRLRDGGENIMLEVEDSGPGIPDEILPRVFDLVFTTKEEGTGLGLFSCKAAVEQHGGSMRVHNNPTTFVIELPKDTGAISSSSIELDRAV